MENLRMTATLKYKIITFEKNNINLKRHETYIPNPLPHSVVRKSESNRMRLRRIPHHTAHTRWGTVARRRQSSRAGRRNSPKISLLRI